MANVIKNYKKKFNNIWIIVFFYNTYIDPVVNLNKKYYWEIYKKGGIYIIIDK